MVGNGFDLSLGYESSYAHFRAFFGADARRYLQGDEEGEDIWEQVDQVAGEDWCEFESGLVNVGLPVGVGDQEYADEGDLSELDVLVADGDEYVDGFTNGLADAFTEWITGLKPGAKRPSKQATHLARTSDAIVTFNYTDSLQEVFSVDEKKVLHIHGTAGGPSRPYFGGPKTLGRTSVGGSNGLTGSVRQEALTTLVSGLTKRPRTHLLDALLTHCQALQLISSFGFSFGDADRPYVQHLIERYSTRLSRISWNLRWRSPA